MVKQALALCLCILLMGFDAPSPPDPFVVIDPVIAGQAQFKTPPTARQITINPAQKTLVLIVAGQSNWTSINPTLFTPTNGSVVSQLNLYDGAFYPITSDVLGSSYYQGTFGPGNPSVRVADGLV